MASVHNFRPALNGFNREDVVHYIEFINNRNKAQLDQMHNQLKTAQMREKELLERVDQAQAYARELEEKLAQQAAAGEPANATEEELEAYRRAERAERLAQERAQQIYEQAKAVLSNATASAKNATSGITALTDRMMALLEEYRQSVADTCDTFRDAAEALRNIDK